MKFTLVGFIILFVFSTRFLYSQEFVVSRVNENKFEVRSTSFSQKDKYQWSTWPDSWSGAKSLALESSDDTLALESYHPIIKRSAGKKAYYGSPRVVALSGAINFRDIGGYKTKDGKQVKWGKIYRSADISKLTDSDLKILSDLHLKMVCDLRGEQEATTSPDKLPEGVERILLPAGSENVGGASSFMKYMKDPTKADSMITSFYTRTDHLTKKYKPVFDQLLSLEDNKAMMFHCTAGKDRTGIGAALILTSLGVDREIIFQDYELTNQYSKPLLDQFMARAKAQGLSEQAAGVMMAAKREYLQAAFAAIEKKFGSVDQFLTNEIGLSAEKRKVLQSKFLY